MITPAHTISYFMVSEIPVVTIRANFLVVPVSLIDLPRARAPVA